MEVELTQVLKQHGLMYVPIDNEQSLKCIYELFVLNKLPLNFPNTSTEYLYAGTYHHYISKTYEKAIEFYESAIAQKNPHAMRRLGIYYKDIGKTKKAIEYWKKAADLGDSTAMHRLGDYHYYNYKGNIDEAMKYWNMAIELNYVESMISMGCYYRDNTEYVEAVKFWEMAVQHGNTRIIKNLCSCYTNLEMYNKILDIAYIYNEWEQWVAAFIRYNNFGNKYLTQLITISDEHLPPLLLAIKKPINEIVNLLEVAITQGGTDFEEAREDFMQKLTS